jgi:hypothetical protein
MTSPILPAPSAFASYPDSEYGTKLKTYTYDLKLEVGMSKGIETVSVNAIFVDFLHRMTDAAGHPLPVSDTQDINVCIRIGHGLERVNVVIFKDPGVYKIHRLRVIHIYEADFNLLLAVKWRQLLHLADKSGLLNEGQLGGRPGCEAQSLTLLKEIKYDISYMSRSSLFNFDNDTTSCYDRIILALASLVNRKYGQSRQVVTVHAKTLEEARYKLRMALRLSDTEYSHCIQFPLYGTGQGSGNSSCIWLFISSTLFDIHDEQAHGAQFMSPDGHESIRIMLVGFVDGTTGSCNDFRPQTQLPIDELAQKMEHDAQIWQDLLHASGGALELTKSSFQTLHFTFLPNSQPQAVIDATDHAIQLRDSMTGRLIPITALPADKAHKTLGHYKAPADQKQKRQLAEILTKAKRNSVLIGTSPISQDGATLAYFSIFLSAVKYPLPQSFFDKKTLDRTKSKVMGTIITRCGYNRHTTYAILYAPMSFAGGGFVHWYTLQGEGQIQQFLKHWRTDTMISRMLRIDLAWSQWQSGLSRPIINATATPLPHLECCWLRSLRNFLQYSTSQLHVNQPFT